eukprot:TRINITY_DN99388_c0_g1_i1.p1 TRINITY_DN99388_c0_g1~~TRINITY_DN99388_c0_g1_i1.p1  ORF type:complete len:203 (-),score=12.74 TRINITY_DN99388_c0_g1_i1:100-708(-)
MSDTIDANDNALIQCVNELYAILNLSPLPPTKAAFTDSQTHVARHTQPGHPNHISRSDLGRRLFGSRSDGTEASHLLSFSLFNAINTRRPGRPASDATKKQIIRILNATNNLRLLPWIENRRDDVVRDNHILDIILHGVQNSAPLTSEDIDDICAIAAIAEALTMSPYVGRVLNDLVIDLYGRTIRSYRSSLSPSHALYLSS